MKFGLFLAPFHRLGENPTLALERDFQLIELLDPRDVVQEGQEVEVKIIDINTQDRKVALSMKALIGEGDDYREYLRRQAEGSKARLGDVMASKLKK